MKKLQVLDFWAEWCGPCRAMNSTVESLMEQYNTEGSDVEIKKVNVDADPEMAQKYGVTGIPTFVFVKDGSEVNRLRGAQVKSKIIETIDRSLN